MPNWDTNALKAVVADWYGLQSHQMPMRVMTREEEIDGFITDHPEMPFWAWEAVNHSVRQVFLWLRRPDVDILVWCPESESPKMAQDVCFKDAYPDDASWHNAMRDLIADPKRKVWIVFHE